MVTHLLLSKKRKTPKENDVNDKDDIKNDLIVWVWPGTVIVTDQCVLVNPEPAVMLCLGVGYVIFFSTNSESFITVHWQYTMLQFRY